jgi:hypothetical protein
MTLTATAKDCILMHNKATTPHTARFNTDWGKGRVFCVRGRGRKVSSIRHGARPLSLVSGQKTVNCKPPSGMPAEASPLSNPTRHLYIHAYIYTTQCIAMQYDMI